jgi:hypothetical protein
MKNRLFYIYFFFVNLLFVLSLYSFIYIKFIHKDVYVKYIPENRIVPQYDLQTEEITNEDEVNYWSDTDYVPCYGIILFKLYKFNNSYGIPFYLILLLLFIPIYLIFRKRLNIIYWVIIIIELISCFFIFQYIFI